MSGICVLLNRDRAPLRREHLEAMTDAGAHRGSHPALYWWEGHVGMSSLPLPTTPESGPGDKLIADDSVGLVMTADARVDNREDLISALGESVRSPREIPTDEELILSAYLKWSSACPFHIIGDFAFAIWNTKRQELFCARDPSGIKPLHYAFLSKTFIVASEGQQILRHPAMSWELDETAIADYIASTARDSARPLFSSINRLSPGYSLTVSEKGARTEQYWDIDPCRRIRYKDETEYISHFNEIFDRSVTARLRSRNGHTGIFLSGGMDSPSVLGSAVRSLEKTDSSVSIQGYSFIYKMLQECDEHVYISHIERKLGVKIHYFNPEEYPVLAGDSIYRPSLESPVLGAEAVNHKALERMKSDKVDVVLTGNGGDHMAKQRPLAYMGRLFRDPFALANEIAEHGKRTNRSPLRLFYRFVLCQYLPRFVRNTLDSMRGIQFVGEVPPWIKKDFSARHDLARSMDFSGCATHVSRGTHGDFYKKIIFRRPQGRTFEWYDLKASVHEMEARHPFFDRRIPEFMLAVPPWVHNASGVSKSLLRKAMAGSLPPEVTGRSSKTSIDQYWNYFLYDKQSDTVVELFKDSFLENLGIINGKILIDRFLARSPGQGYYGAFGFWRTITLELWLREHGSKFSKMIDN